MMYLYIAQKNCKYTIRNQERLIGMRIMKLAKSLLLSLTLLLLMLCALPVQGQAAGVVAERKDEWVLTDDGVLTIKDGDIFTSFLSNYKDQILHVVLEEGVVECPNFNYNFPSLQTVTMPDSVETLGTFIKCTALETVRLPSGITAIPEEMFLGCSALKNVEIPDSVTQIGASAFSGCSALQSVVIPDGVTAIGKSAFNSCTALTEIVLPEGLTVLEANVFSGCSGLKTVVLPKGLTVIDQGAFYACKELVSPELPEGLESIGARAFSWCIAIETINWPANLTSIGAYAFEYCTALKEVVLQCGAVIGESAFYECTGLETAILPEGTTLAAGGRQFSQCESLKTVTIPAGITEIPEGFVLNSLALEEVIIPDGVTKIGKYAFAFCDNVERVYLPASVKTLGSSAFAYGGSNNIWEKEWHVFFGGTEQQWGNWEIVDEKYEGENANQLLVMGHEVFLGEGFAEYCTDQCVKCSQCDKHYNEKLELVTHTFADGKCTACGAEETVTQPSEPTEPEDTTPSEPTIPEETKPSNPGDKCKHPYIEFILDNDSHQAYCKDCNTVLYDDPHIFLDGKCVCGMDESEVTNPSEPGVCIHGNLELIVMDSAIHNVRCKECGIVLRTEPHAFEAENKCGCGLTDPDNIPTVCKHENAKLQAADNLYHHYWCVDCLVVVGVDEPHMFEYAKDPADENVHIMRCSACGFSNQVNHEFVAGQCACGAVFEPASEPEPTECLHGDEFLEFTQVDDEYHTGLCGNCGAVVRHMEAHDFEFTGNQCVCGAMGCTHWDEFWEYRPKDEYSHYVDCSNCGMMIDDKMGHEFVDGVCVCGASVKEEEPELIENPFADIKESEYYYEPVLWAGAKGITNGMTPTEFMPDKICTRGQIVTFLWRAKGEPEPAATNNPFTDVKSGDYFYKAVLWAVEEGITNGTGAGVFSPNADCTRGQVATFLWRSMGEPAPNSQSHSFTDIKKGEYYYDAVLWAVEHGVTNGTSPTTFAPGSPCTRGQIVTFLYRALN